MSCPGIKFDTFEILVLAFLECRSEKVTKLVYEKYRN